MKSSVENIINQLEEQNIQYNLLHKKDVKATQNLILVPISKWKEKFIPKNNIPFLEPFLWHVFSFNITQSIKGDLATKEYFDQWKSDVIIFNESQDFTIYCVDSIPKLSIKNINDDIYISHHNMKWTYIIPHETPFLGPFFSKG